MTQQALGLIEAVGLPVAIEAADAALKAANVTLIGYEKTKGMGYIVVKLRGDVGAVKAAVEAGVASASRVGKVFSHHVIPRPHENTELLISQVDRGPGQHRGMRQRELPPAEEVASQPEAAPAALPVEEAAKQPYAAQQPYAAPAPVEEAETTPVEEPAPAPVVDAPAEPGEDAAASVQQVTCNLCNDPACRRQPGQLHRLCIHHKR